jgi:hypothetical protein
MKHFHLERVEDESGVSGTGIVAEGVIFSNGKCAINWLTKYSSIAVYENIEDVEFIHGHNGKTKVVLEDALLSAAKGMLKVIDDHATPNIRAHATTIWALRSAIAQAEPDKAEGGEG